MDVIYQAMMYLLNTLHDVVGSYGWSIVLLTVLIRLALWPLNSAQTRSMRRMQEIQPKMKALQERHKNDPQKLQMEMMAMYKESGLNPLAGCLPMIAQIPIFLGLYGALSSPQFLAQTVHENFLFINNLSHTMRTHAGTPIDGTFNIKDNDTFAAAQHIKLTMFDGKTVEQNVAKPNEVISVTPKPMLPGSPVTMTLDFQKMGLSSDYGKLVKSADVLVTDNASRELENITFNNVNGALTTPVPTKEGKDQFNYDVLGLVAVYALLTFAYQKIMTHWAPKPNKDDQQAAAQANMMKFMPLMFVAMMFFIPIPAGALIYLIVTTALMVIQSVWVNKQEDARTATLNSQPSSQVVNIKADRA